MAYESLPQTLRRLLDARIIEALEALAPDRLSDQVERLAYHALRGEVWDKAVQYCRQAGVKAATCADYREVVIYFEQALKALTHLSESRPTREQAIDLRLNLRAALTPLGEFGQIHSLLRDAEILAEALDDQRRLGRISRLRSLSSWQMGDYRSALASGQHALTLAQALGDIRLQIQANVHMASTYHALGDYRQAIACLSINVDTLEALRPPRGDVPPSGDDVVISRAKLAWYLAELGTFAAGINHSAAAIRMAEAAAHVVDRVHAYVSFGYLHAYRGDLHQAIAELERGMELCRAYQIPVLFPHVASLLGLVYARVDRVVEALPLLEQAMEQAVAMPFVPYIARSLTWLSEAYMMATRLREAMSLAQRALDHAHQYQERGNQAGALWLLGEIASRHDQPEVELAETNYRQALALAEELGMRPLQAHCHVGLGTFYAKIGRRQQARAELSTAIELYRTMDMTFWLPQAEAVLAQV